MLVDFTKAFDCINLDFLFLCLEKLNFGPFFRRWVKVMYTNIHSSVIINGWISESFHVKRGIRQGCPLSALLFIITVELMANKIRKNREIKPLDTKNLNTKIKLLQYANNTLFFVRDPSSLKYIVEELIIFGKVAGPKLNKEKTNMIWIGDSSTK